MLLTFESCFAQRETAALVSGAQGESASAADAWPENAGTLAARRRQAQKLSQSLLAQSQRVSAMLSSLLDLARLQSGAVRLNLQWQPLGEVIVSMADEGPGLHQGKEELIFKEFTRGERESSTPGVASEPGHLPCNR